MVFIIRCCAWELILELMITAGAQRRSKVAVVVLSPVKLFKIALERTGNYDHRGPVDAKKGQQQSRGERRSVSTRHKTFVPLRLPIYHQDAVT